MYGVWRTILLWGLVAVVFGGIVLASELPPSVQLRPVKDEAKVGEPCIFEVSIVNPISPSGKNMTAQIVLKVPPNVVVYGESFTKSGSGQYVAVFKSISPGDAVYQRVYVKGLKPGEYIVSADLVWYWEGEQTPHTTSLDYNIKFIGDKKEDKSNVENNETSLGTGTHTSEKEKGSDTPSPQPKPLPEIPWQYIVIVAIVAIVLVVALFLK